MKMQMGTAHNLLSQLQRIDNDPGIRLPDETHLAIAININRLSELVLGYEKTRNRIVLELRAEAAEQKRALDEVALMDRDVALREKEGDFPELRKVKLADLKPKGDVRVTGLSALAPMIEGFDTGEGKDA